MSEAKFEPTPHPLLPIPTREQLLALGPDEAFRVMTDREKIIQAEQDDPVRYGWEPPMWRIAWAIMGMPWIPADEARRIREAAGFSRPRHEMLISGCNRSGKSRFGAATVMKLLQMSPKKRARCFSDIHQNSVENQQPYIWEFIEQERRRQVKSAVAYISYTQKNGFSDNRLVLDNASECSFRLYEQDEKASEGGEVDIVWADEHCPADLAKRLSARVATRNGWLLLTFTPTEGYTPAVAMFQNGATTTVNVPGYLLPRDGGAPIEDKPFQPIREVNEILRV